MAFLKKWYRKDPRLATVNRLMDALVKIDRKDVASLIGKIYAGTPNNTV